MEREGLVAKHRGFEIQAYFGRIYNYMAGGLLMSALMAWLSVREPLLSVFYQQTADGMISFTLWGWLAIVAPLIVIFLIGNATSKLNVKQAQLWFWVFSALMGISLGNIFFLYSGVLSRCKSGDCRRQQRTVAHRFSVCRNNHAAV